MAKTSSPSGRKRAREKEQRERNQEKQKRLLEKRERKATSGSHAPGEDPDLAGMVPGPQPRDPELLDEPADESADELADEDT